MNATIKDNTLTLQIPLNTDPKASSTGKTLIVASTGGFAALPVQFQGKPVKLNLTATIKP